MISQSASCEWQRVVKIVVFQKSVSIKKVAVDTYGGKKWLGKGLLP